MIKLGTVESVIIHCSATTEDMDVGVEEIRRWHTEERGWEDIGYHYVIRRDGRIEQGRSSEYAGAHCRGKNSTSLGICLIGGARRTDGGKIIPEFNIKDVQLISLRELIGDLKEQHPTISEVTGHNTYSKKPCPTFNVSAWYAYGDVLPVEDRQC